MTKNQKKNIDVLESVLRKARGNTPNFPERIDCEYCGSEQSCIRHDSIKYTSLREDIVDLLIKGYLCELCGEPTYSQESLADILRYKEKRNGNTHIVISIGSSGEVLKKVVH